MHSFKTVLILVILFSLAACRSAKTVTGTEVANPALLTKDIIKTHNSAVPEFETMAGRIKVAYKDAKQSQSMTVSLRMERDKKIWIKASLLGITLAKALITPERATYYETLSNTYFDGDFSILSEWLGTDVDFAKTQAILLGQSIFDMDSKGYTSAVEDNKYKMEPKLQFQNFLHAILLNPDNFKVSEAEVTQPAFDRHFKVTYGPYQQLDAGFFPSEVFIRSKDGEDFTSIDVTYRKIDLNVSVSFPYTIPEGYEQINLGE